MEELKDKKQFGKRGEVVVVMQIVTSILAIFPPMKLYGVVYFAGALRAPHATAGPAGLLLLVHCEVWASTSARKWGHGLCLSFYACSNSDHQPLGQAWWECVRGIGRCTVMHA